MRHTPRRQVVDRSDLSGAREPSGGVARPPVVRLPEDGDGKRGRVRNIDPVEVAVPDAPEPGAPPNPYTTGHERTLATLNLRTDLLEEERAKGPERGISVGAYQQGREAQQLLERGVHISGGGQWRDSGRYRAEKEVEDDYGNKIRVSMAIVHGVDGAATRLAEIERLIGAAGSTGARILVWILGEGLNYIQVAGKLGGTNGHDVYYARRRFCDALEDVAADRAARGRR